MLPPTILILTHRADHFTVDRVAAAIERLGARAVRFDTDRFPSETRLSAALDGDGSRFTLHEGGTTLDLAAVTAVWARRVWPAALDAGLDAKFHDACRRESRAALEACWDGCAGAHWVNPPAADRRASDKLLQLRLARELGLAIPRTLLTNDPGEARAFFDESGGDVVAKMLTPLSTGMEAGGEFVYTSPVSAADLDAAGTLRHSPMLFQERVPKASELRVVVVREQVFAGAIDATRSAQGTVDWRRATPVESRWERAAVPETVAGPLRALVGALGLEYAAIDLIRTPAGAHVFLEVNPGGEWGMLERDLDLDISGALARTLCGG